MFGHPRRTQPRRPGRRVVWSWLPALVLCAAPCWAQIETPPSFPHVEAAQDVTLDDYEIPAEGALTMVESQTIIAGDVHNGQWMRIHFDRVNIGSTDYLVIRSVIDGWEYTVQGNDLYARGVEGVDVPYFSLFMTGNSVEIELWAEPGSSGGGAHVDYVHHGVARESNPDFCSDDQASFDDWRVARIVAYRSVPLYNGDRYMILSGALMFPGSCILTSALALDRVDLNADNVIVQFDEVVLEGGAVRPHPRPQDQYRFLASSDCVGPAHGRALTFKVRSNEDTGRSPGLSYRDEGQFWFGGPQCVDPGGFVPIINTGYIGGVSSWLDLTQTQDWLYGEGGGGGQDFITEVNDDGRVRHDSDAASFGFQGAPILEDALFDDDLTPLEETERKLYGISTAITCGLGTHEGISFHDSDLDLDSPTSCVTAACNSGNAEFPLIRVVNDPTPGVVIATMSLSLSGGPMTVQLDGRFGLREVTRHMFGDGKQFVGHSVPTFDLSGTSCMGPLEVRKWALTPAPARWRFFQTVDGSIYPAQGLAVLPIEVLVGDLQLHTATPARLVATVDDMPGYDDVYTLETPIALLDTQGQQVGTLDAWTVTLRRPRPSLFTTAQLHMGSLGNVTVYGTSQYELGSTSWSEPARAWVTPVEWIDMDMRASEPDPMPAVLSESASGASAGLLTYAFMPDTFPAREQGDLYIEIALPLQQRTLVNPQPIRLAGTWRASIPTGDTLRSTGPVALHDKATGAFVTMLDEMILFAQDPLTGEAYPAAGTDAYCASGRLVVDLGQGPMTVSGLLGRARVVRSEPHPEPASGLQRIDTELLSMDLHGSSSSLGSLIVRRWPGAPAPGAIEQLDSGFSFPAASWFDVFLEIQTANGPLHSEQPFRIRAEIGSIPPTEEHASMTTQAPVPLLNAQGKTAGMLMFFALQPGTPYDPACPASMQCSPIVLGVESPRGAGTGSAQLLPVVPNPAHGSARFAIDVARAGDMSLGVYDVAGRLVHELARGRREAGTHRFEWNGSDRTGRRVATGVYFARLRTEEGGQTRAIILK